MLVAFSYIIQPLKHFHSMTPCSSLMIFPFYKSSNFFQNHFGDSSPKYYYVRLLCDQGEKVIAAFQQFCAKLQAHGKISSYFRSLSFCRARFFSLHFTLREYEIDYLVENCVKLNSLYFRLNRLNLIPQLHLSKADAWKKCF
jgi:hypothetical protein